MAIDKKSIEYLELKLQYLKVLKKRLLKFKKASLDKKNKRA